MTPALVTELKRLEQEADFGPAAFWYSEDDGDMHYGDRSRGDETYCLDQMTDPARLKLLAALLNHAPALLEAVETMHAALLVLSCKNVEGPERKSKRSHTEDCARCSALARVAGLLEKGRGK